MRDVEARTGLPRSTIQLYVKERLLPQPRKTHQNQAYYDEEFIRRAQLVKLLQAKAHLPLSAIRDALEKIPRGAVNAIDPDQVVDVARRVSETLRIDSAGDVEERELLRTTSIRASDLASLKAAGLIQGRKTARGTTYSPPDVRVALAHAQAAAGYRAVAPDSSRDEYLPSVELLRTYARCLSEVARAETVELVRTARLLAIVDTRDFVTRMAKADRELIAEIHARQFLKQMADLMGRDDPTAARGRARKRLRRA